MYKVRAIKFGNQLYPGPAVFYFKYWNEWIYVDFYFWLLQSAERNILVDVGLDKAFAAEASPHIIRRLNDPEGRGELIVTIDPPDALAQLGVPPESIKHVILSHCHLDHVACLHGFPNATFITSRYGLEWIVNPPYQGLIDPYGYPTAQIEWLHNESQKTNGRVILTDDDATPVPGVRTVRTGGHSMDSQIIFVETEKGMVGLGVDNAITYEHIEQDIAPGSPVSLLDARRAMNMLQEEADIIVPGHDPAVTDRYPDGIIVG